MAARVLAFYTLCILLCSCSLHGVVTAASSPLKKSLHLTYYAHEIEYGLGSTLLPAAGTGQGNMSALDWGSFLVFDNAMKAGNSTDSLVLGSITGTTAVTTIGGNSTSGRGSQINLHHIFKEGSGKYNGSSLTVIGHILTPIPVAEFECIVIGGTGALRGYSGYGILKPVPNAPVSPLSRVFQWDVYITRKKH